jgi:RNA:NAD 2'-phosphotransferase (TPT1/KptA family)
MTAKDYKNKSIEISMTTISKVKRHATEEIKITQDKTGFKVAIKKDMD